MASVCRRDTCEHGKIKTLKNQLQRNVLGGGIKNPIRLASLFKSEVEEGGVEERVRCPL